MNGSDDDALATARAANASYCDTDPQLVVQWARIRGRLPPEQDRPVILGNHRDAWVFGAAGKSTIYYVINYYVIIA